MSSSPKRRAGMSPTTIVLVLVLLGAVAGASRLVTPPPPLPPPEVKVDPAIQAAQSKAMVDSHMKEMQFQMEQNKLHASMPAPPPDPNAVEVRNDYFISHKPGEEGLKQNDKEYKEKEAKWQEYQRTRGDIEAKAKEKLKKLAPVPIQAPTK